MPAERASSKGSGFFFFFFFLKPSSIKTIQPPFSGASMTGLVSLPKRVWLQYFRAAVSPVLDWLVCRPLCSMAPGGLAGRTKTEMQWQAVAATQLYNVRPPTTPRIQRGMTTQSLRALSCMCDMSATLIGCQISNPEWQTQ